MEKQEADKLIAAYIRRLFGFAVSRLSDINEAEELAEEITVQVYESLLRQDNIKNPDGYIFRVAKNVYARHICGKKQFTSADGIECISDSRNLERELSDREGCIILRREITYLSELRREIIILHYFRDKKVKEIAELLSLSENTVKWHLACSRKELKEGMEKLRATGELGTQPIRLIGMGHRGSPGTNGDTSIFLAKSLTQNIAYAAYHQPRSINEIADELGVNPIFVKDEVDTLEEYGFMDKLSDGRYRTNIQIDIQSKESNEIYDRINPEYTKLFADRLFKPVLEGITEIPDWLSVPDNDVNLLKWLMTFVLASNLGYGKIDFGKYSVKRPDGGNYVAFAELLTEYTPSYNKYWCCGAMTRTVICGNTEASSWQMNCRFTDRQGNWQDNLSDDYCKLYYFISGKLPESPENAESYKRLLDKGYLLKGENGYKCNVIVCRDAEKWNSFIPDVPVDIVKLSEEYSREAVKAELINQPKHMHAQITEFAKSAASGLNTRIAENLLEAGVLKMPSDEQKKGLLTVMFA